MTILNIQELESMEKHNDYWCQAYTRIPIYGTVKCTLKNKHGGNHHWYYLKTHDFDESQVTLRGKS